MKNIILASGSPRRKELLSQIGLEFTVMTSDADETISKTVPGEIVMEIACKKAGAVYEKVKETVENCCIIGADTIVYSDGEILTKPVDEQNAYDMLKKLSGNIHQVYTGVSVISEGKIHSFYEKTDVEFYEISDDEIKQYISTGDPFDKAGAYGIQGVFAKHVKGIRGDYNNVVGLPTGRLYQELKMIL